MDPLLPHRTQALFDRLKNFPDAGKRGDDTVLKKDAFLALLDLRILLEREIIPALHAYERDQREWVTVPRLED